MFLRAFVGTDIVWTLMNLGSHWFTQDFQVNFAYLVIELPKYSSSEENPNVVVSGTATLLVDIDQTFFSVPLLSASLDLRLLPISGPITDAQPRLGNYHLLEVTAKTEEEVGKKNGKLARATGSLKNFLASGNLPLTGVLEKIGEIIASGIFFEMRESGS